jgi:glutathione S-transferase
MADEKQPDYELIYWPAQGRGQFVRILFAEANVKLKNSHNVPDYAVCKDAKRPANEWPCFAPPILKVGDQLVGQTNSIVRFAAARLRLLPESDLDQARADQIMNNIQDAWGEAMKQENADKGDVRKFLDTRFAQWMGTFERPLKVKKGQQWYFGDKISVADLIVSDFMVKLQTLFGKCYEAEIAKKYPTLQALRDRVEARPRIKECYKGFGQYPEGPVLEKKLAK